MKSTEASNMAPATRAASDNGTSVPPAGRPTYINRAVASTGDGPAAWDTSPTTSFLTATTLIYAIGAGITAAAGTRLALQWILVKVFKLCSFRLRGLG
jgi:hypothetical protein